MTRPKFVRCLILLSALCGLAATACRSGADDRVTPPPGQETPEIARTIDLAKSALERGTSVSDALTDKNYLPVHAWPRFRGLIRQHAAAGELRLTAADEPGEALHVRGVVRDAQGKPVADVLLYAYHTSAKGWYSDRAAHISGNGGDTNHARLFGYLKTDAQGKFALRTIRPAGYPGTDLPGHIHVMIEKAGRPALWTEIQFEDDPRLTARWREQSKQAGFVICPVRKDEQGVQHVEAEFRLKG
jgi:protocatechuate 3,4-dioxygenase beta subunit